MGSHAGARHCQGLLLCGDSRVGPVRLGVGLGVGLEVGLGVGLGLGVGGG